MRHDIELAEGARATSHRVMLEGPPGRRRISIDDRSPLAARLVPLGEGRYDVALGDGPEALRTELRAEVHGDTVHLAAFGRSFALTIVDPVEQAHAASRAAELVCRAPMPGVVVELHAAAGDAVHEGQPLLTIESMKLLTVVAAPATGVLERIGFAPGASFPKGAVLATVHAADAADPPAHGDLAAPSGPAAQSPASARE